MNARARIEAWIEATRRVTRPYAPALVESIASESGLSPQGVSFALDDVLEIDRAPAELSRFLANPSLSVVGERSSVAIVLASTVPTAGFRAVAWALAQSPRVVVRPSRRCRALVSTIVEACGGLVALAPPSDRPEDDLRALVDDLGPRSALHVYGGDETLDAARAATNARDDLHLELHGPGFGVVIAPEADVIDAARAIALDVVAFDQRGCLSPRLVLAVGSASKCVDALHAALDVEDTLHPRGDLDDDERSAIVICRDAALFKGRVLESAGHLVLDLGIAVGLSISPVGRVLPVESVRDLDHAMEHLRPIASRVTRIATIDAWRERLESMAPTCALGEMQRPAFDGPVDKRIR
jgi:hypothetical protein